MPKAELHLHLDGSLRPETAVELARTGRGAALQPPTDLQAMRARLAAPARGVDQIELLRAFELPVALLQDGDSLARCTRELVEDVAAEGTRYAEIRWAPSLHLAGGLALREGIGAVVEAARAAAARASIHVRLIAVALRTHPPDVAERVARAAVSFAPHGLTGFDLAGVEEAAPDPRAFAGAFDTAREGGLGITCHAGEWGGPGQVRAALAISPWRIAHGAPAADDPALARELADRGVTLDLCPSSNLQAGIGSGDPSDPLPRLVRLGVPATISTDDRTVSQLTLVEELHRCLDRLKLTPWEVAAAVRQAYLAAFLHHDEDLRARLLGAFDGWLAGHPPQTERDGP
jgi:adenosine deaminase